LVSVQPCAQPHLSCASIRDTGAILGLEIFSSFLPLKTEVFFTKRWNSQTAHHRLEMREISQLPPYKSPCRFCREFLCIAAAHYLELGQFHFHHCIIQEHLVMLNDKLYSYIA